MMQRFKIRGCCRKCKLLKKGVCKENHVPIKKYNSQIYGCKFQQKPYKQKIKDEAKKKKDLIEKLDEVFGNYIRYRDKGYCITCGKQFNPADRVSYHPGHYISRKKMSVRFDEKNVWGQCAICNGNQNWNSDNGYMQLKLLEKNLITLGDINELYKKSRTIKKWENFELEDMIKIYEKKLNEIRG